MGGKSSNTTSTTSIPPEVLARYNAVNAQAQNVAGTPFQQYSQNPSAFVAPLTSTQTAGIQNTNQTAGAAQPFYGVGTGLTLAGAGPVNAGQIGGQQIGQYMSPFLGSVVGTTMANLRQQQQQEQSGELGNQISRGAFGGDRGRIAQANLARQQNLATGQTVSGLMNQGYGQALQTAQQQQGVNLGAEQANQARLMQAGQQIAGLGAGAQTAGLQGAQAQLAAGTAEQQTNQAGQTALYNQYLQQQGYPFQVAQFLANIAMGTGALSGQTTVTQQPSSFFSDKRLKEDIEPIGETFDGQKIVKFRYKGEPGKQIGLIAQDVEKHHPEAVGLAGGYKTVDYDKATKHAADKGHYLHGGLVSQSEGGAVYEDRAGQGYAAGGETSDDMAEILRLLSPPKTTTPYGKVGLYGQSSKAAGPYKISLTDASTRRISPVQELALREPGYVRAPAFAHGGLAPDGYGIGGSLPYHQAEGEYVPEDITGSQPTPKMPESPKTGSGQSGPSDFETAMKVAKLVAMFAKNGGAVYASGGLVPHMADGGSPDFATLLARQQAMYENMPGAKGGAGGLNIPQQQPQRRPEMLRPSPMPSAPTESGFKQVVSAADSGSKFGDSAEKIYDASKRGLSGSEAQPALYNRDGQLVRDAKEASPGLLDFLSRQSSSSGGLVPRHGYALDGEVDDPTELWDPESELKKRALTIEALKNPEPNTGSGFAPILPRPAPVDRPYNSQEREAFRIGRIEDKQEGDRMRAYEAAQKAAADATASRARDADKTFREEDLGLGQSYAMNAERENMATARAQRVADVSMANEERKNASLQKKQGIENYFQNIPMVKGVVGSLPSYKKQADVAGEVLTGLGRGAASVGSPIYNAAGNLINFTTGLKMPTAEEAFGIGSVPKEFGNAVKGVSEAYNRSPAGAAADVAATTAPVLDLDNPVVPIASSAPRIVSSASAAPATAAAAAPAGLAPLPPASYVRTLKAEPLKNEGYESGPADTSDGSAGVSADAAERDRAAAEAKNKADAAAKAKADADKAKPGLLSRIGDTVSSRDFLIPLLSGLGAMAASPSRYLGSAILQGLAGGASAAQGVQKQSADIAKIESGIVNDSLVSDPVSKLVFQRVFDPKTGTYDFISPMEYQKNKSKYRLSPFAPNEPRSMTAVTAATTPATTQTTAPAAPSSTTAPAGTNAPIYRELPNDQRMNDLIKSNVDRTQFGSVPDPSADPFTDASKRAVEARNNTQNLMTLADALSKSPSGPFQAGVVAPLTGWLNSISNAAGVGNLFDPTQLSYGQVVDKINTQLASMNGQQGTEGYKKLEALKESIPSNFNSPEGKAKLIASILTNNRQAIDEDNFYKLYQKRLIAEGVMPQFVQSAGMGLKEEFTRRQAPQYQQEEKVLEDLYLKPLKGSNGNVINPSTMSYIIKSGGQVPAGFIAAMEKTYAPQYGAGIANRVLRIFGAGE